MQHIPQPREIYRHFKGNTYQILTIAEHSETGEMLVIYQAMYGDYKTYARPINMFLEKIDKEKYPQATQEYRFEMLDATPDTEGMEATASDEEEELPVIDPQVLKFLDADTYEERLDILTGLHHRITDDMLNVMAIATDIELKPGDIEERYIELKNCLLKLEKFECNRLR
ncbi:MAG: DUF1653 domain-containing protein [Clostridiales bacterium]|nr:DUF1653 domain-containing protein [Clostridiales bacterium]